MDALVQFPSNVPAPSKAAEAIILSADAHWWLQAIFPDTSELSLQIEATQEKTVVS